MWANLPLQPTPPSAARLSGKPLGRKRIKASLWQRKGRSEARRARGRAAGRGQKGRSGRTAVGRVSPPPLVAPARTREPTAPISGQAAGSAVSLAGAGWKGGPGREGRAAGIPGAVRSGARGVSGGQWAGGSGIRPPGVGGRCGRGRKGRRAGSPPAAPMRWQAKRGRSLRPEALWAGARGGATRARWQGRREEGAVALPGRPGEGAGGGWQGGARWSQRVGQEGRGRPNLRFVRPVRLKLAE